MDKDKRKILNEHKALLCKLIEAYKNQPLLWQKNHPQYRNKVHRNEAFAEIVKFCQGHYPETDEDFVRIKIESMRSCFRKERKKVLLCREKGSLYKPTLWYYHLLLFTAGEDVEKLGANDAVEETRIRIPVWNRQHTALLISLYKDYPCLYCITHPKYRNNRRRRESLQKIALEMENVTGKPFSPEGIRRKIAYFYKQFLVENKKVTLAEDYKPNLWCYEMLKFLSAGSNNKREDQLKRRKENNSEDEYSADNKPDFNSVNLDEKIGSDRDIFETIARNVAHKLREMTEEQRIYAEKIVKDVMYHGQMENLTIYSRLMLDDS